MDYKTLNDLINAQGPTVISGGGFYYDPTTEGGGSGGSGYAEPSTYEENVIYQGDKGYIREPDGSIREFYTKEPKREFNKEAQASGYYTNVYNPNGTVSRVFQGQRGPWGDWKPAVLSLAALGTLGYSLGALGAAGAGGAGGAAGAGAGLADYAAANTAITAADAAFNTGIAAGGAGAGGAGALTAAAESGPGISSGAADYAAANSATTAADAAFNTGIPATSAGATGSNLLRDAAKSAASKLLDPKLLASLGAGAGVASLTARENQKKIGPVGFQGTIDPNRLKYNRETGEYTVRATGEKYAAGGGIAGLKPNEYKAGGRYLSGPGDGMSDNIRANIDGQQEARLADGEFVIPADVVSHIGNGSSNAGAKKLHAMMNRIRHARTGNPKQGKQIKPEKYLPA